MAKFLEDYDTVETRLARFWEAHPEGRVLTKLEFHDERRFIVLAEIFFDRDDSTPVSTGYAEEIVGASNVNKTSALENCETSAIGRGLANCGFASLGKRPSKEEMDKVQRYQDEPRKPAVPSARFYSPEDIAKASEGIKKAHAAQNLDALRKLWNEFFEYSDCPIEGTTLKSVVNLRKRELQ